MAHAAQWATHSFFYKIQQQKLNRNSAENRHALNGSLKPSEKISQMRGLNGHWGIDRNARGKAARYGKDVMDRAVAFLQDAINTVLKIIQ